MNERTWAAGTRPYGLSLGRSLLVALPMLLLTAVLILGPLAAAKAEPLYVPAVLAAYLLFNGFFFAMLYTGETHRWRAGLFVAMAVGFVLSIIPLLLDLRGTMMLSEVNIVEGETPFCHLVIPMIIVPAALTRTIIFPGSILGGFASIAPMVVLWLGATLALGRGWCSWVCFFGGLDEGFSCLARRPAIRQIDQRWTYLPYAVLLAVVLTSAVALSPTYCEWLCPYKVVTEFAEITSLTTVIQTVLFGSLFAGLVIVLPILTRRRTQCGLFCPFGAMQSFLNKINVFDVRVDRARCTGCLLCAQTCPTFSLDEASIKAGRTRLSCTKCGRCVDRCPRQAISFHVKGTRVGVGANTARILFLYPAHLLLAVLGAQYIGGGLFRLLKLLITGSML